MTAPQIYVVAGAAYWRLKSLGWKNIDSFTAEVATAVTKLFGGDQNLFYATPVTLSRLGVDIAEKIHASRSN